MKKIPIRNKSKDNPYTLKFNDVKNTYVVEFKDNKNILHNIEISDKVYEAFNQFELDDVSQIHKYQRHIEHSEIYEETLNSRAIRKELSVYEIVENKIIAEILKEAIDMLPEIQKRRIIKYFFMDKTYEQIASEEKCTKIAVKYSIDRALEKIAQNFKF